MSLRGVDGGLRLLDQLAHEGWTGLDRLRSGGGRAPGGSVRIGQDDISALDERLECIPHQRVGTPGHVQEAGTARRRGKDLRHVHEQASARLGHGSGRGHLPEREAQGPHGIGHHLLVPYGDVHVALRAFGDGDREEGGDRPALDEPELAVSQAPFDILRPAEVRLDTPTERRQQGHLRVRQDP